MADFTGTPDDYEQLGGAAYAEAFTPQMARSAPPRHGGPDVANANLPDLGILSRFSARAIASIVWPLGVFLPALMVGVGASMIEHHEVAVRLRSGIHALYWLHWKGEAVAAVGAALVTLGAAVHCGLCCCAFGRRARQAP